MACGKTTAGRHLARELGWDFFDTDELVERHEGRTIEQIFHQSGEGRFRRAEWECLQALGGRARMVVATGGGLFLGTVQRRWIKERGRSLWLDLPLAECVARKPPGSGRPLWPAQDRTALRALFERRRAAYALADWRVDARGGDPRQVVRRILERLDS
jgi:shikimate kinase